MAVIDCVELDLRRFERTGKVGLRGRPQDPGSRKADRINLGQQIAAVADGWVNHRAR